MKEYRKLCFWAIAGLLSMIICFILSSCKTRPMYIPFETKTLDSIVFHDTIFREKLIPYKDSVALPDTTSFLSNPYAYSHAKWSNGMLHHSLGIYPFATVIVKMPYFIEKIRRVEVPKPYPVERELSWWEKFRIDYGGYAIILIIIEILVFGGRFLYKHRKGG